MEADKAIEVFSKINLDAKVIESIRKNKKVVAKLSTMIELAGGKAEKTQGNLLYTLSTKLPPTQDAYAKQFVEQIMKNNWTKVMQLDEAVTFLKSKLIAVGETYIIDAKEFEEATGVGINLTEEDVQKMVDDIWAENQKEIDEKKWDFNFNTFLYKLKETNKWADSKIVNQKIQEK
jgi:glutaminyl-tRNA synthetase